MIKAVITELRHQQIAYVVLNPEGNSDNSVIWVGVLSTVFAF